MDEMLKLCKFQENPTKMYTLAGGTRRNMKKTYGLTTEATL